MDTKKTSSLKQQRFLSSLLVNGSLILICLIFIIPTLGIFITSFRNSQDIFTTGWWTIFPHKADVQSGEIMVDPSVNLDAPFSLPGIEGQFTFEQLRLGVTLPDGRLLTWAFLNSVAVAVPATIIPILIAAFAAFGFAWLNFPGRKLFFVIVVALLVVPLQIALVPIVQDYTKLNLNGTYLAIWLAHTGFGLPLAIYLLFNYISQLPRDILESAFIDGASNFTIFTQLILPLSVPALASFAIFQFLWVWNDYLVALVFLGGQNQVLTVTLANMVGEKGQDWQLLTSGAFISMLLPLAVFFALQRYFVRGLMAGSVKG
jgi:alpha-glucoside transport system permease protein